MPLNEKKIIYLSAFCFILPMILSFIYVYINPAAVQIIANDFQIKQLEKSFDPSLFYLRPEQTLDEDITILNFYIVNNLIIGFAVFLSGLFLGIGTIVILAYQGMSMGLKAGYVSQLGYDETLWPFLIGHTSFELTAIIISGYCGFKISLALLKPKKSSRFKSLLNAFQNTAGIMIVVLMLFLFAAIIETFWSSNVEIHTHAKYLSGTCSWLILIYYLFFFGKKSEV